MKLKKLLKLIDDEKILLVYGSEYYEDDCEKEYLCIKDIKYEYLNRKIAHVGSSILDAEPCVLIALEDE